MAPGRIPVEGGASHGLQTALTHPGQVQGLGCVMTKAPTGLSNLPRAGPAARGPSGATSSLIQNLMLFFPQALSRVG